MVSVDNLTARRAKDGRIVAALDDFRAMDTGIIASMGGFASSVLYTVQSGTNVYVTRVELAFFSGTAAGLGGVIRLLDGTTAKTGPILVTVSTNQGNIVLPVQPGRFVSSVVVENMSGFAGQWGNVNTSFAGSVYAEVLVDPRVASEG